MNNRIDQLLERYLDGATTLDEERTLHALLEKSDRQDHEGWALYFSAMNSQSDVAIPKKADEELLNSFRSVPLHDYGASGKWLAIAASLLLLFLAGQWLRQSGEQPLVTQRSTVESPEKALDETRKALAVFSEKYQKSIAISSQSMEDTKYIDRYFNFSFKQ